MLKVGTEVGTEVGTVHVVQGSTENGVSRALNKLTARQISTLKEAGRHADGGGLYLRITAAGSRSWVFMVTTDGRRAEIGLGSTKALSLAAARALATAMREAAALGRNPRSILDAATPAEAEPTPTFSEFAEAYIASVEAGWKNATHRQQWRNSLRDHAAAIADVPIDTVDTAMVLDVLRPIWLTKAETASRLRGRIEKILDAAKVRGLRPRDALNPASLKGHMALLLPKQGGMVRGHHKALPYAQMPNFMQDLRGRVALAARCLEFTILTAARSGEALGANWGEIDLEQRLWTAPGTRMKAGQEHVVPLSTAAVQLLEGMRTGEVRSTDRIFAIGGATRSNMAMTIEVVPEFWTGG